jgi:hypothetical protein
MHVILQPFQIFSYLFDFQATSKISGSRLDVMSATEKRQKMFDSELTFHW